VRGCGIVGRGLSESEMVLLFGVVEPVEEQLRSDAKLHSRPDMVQRMHTGLLSSHYSNNVLFLVSCEILWG